MARDLLTIILGGCAPRLALRARTSPSSACSRKCLIALALALALGAGGCLRQNFDLCAEDPPHPDCELLDAGPDGSTDGARDGGSDGAP